ncbi:MAG: pyrimidine 5'-nucleotidase [Anaerolineales bacterium]|nr:MAG: pyrimidine 5'-nucleotidase [Anaerolineales bacterium]
MSFSTLFFDLDATLYSSTNGLWDAIRSRIYKFMEEKIGIPKEEIPETRDRYWTTYGTTLEGLRIHHQVNPDDYLSFVHDLPLAQFLDKDPTLRRQLSSLPQDLWVFTNSDHNHAERVLEALGIEDLFSGIVDLLAMDFNIKPNPKAYQIALTMAGETDSAKCVLFDDLLQNLLGAKDIGFTTALVGKNGVPDQVDFHLPTIYDMQKIMPHLWQDA